MNFDMINNSSYNDFLQYLKLLGDEKYKKFHSGIVKNSAYEIIGIRLPTLRKIAKDITNGDFNGYLSNSGTKDYEEVMLRGLVTAQLKGDFNDVKMRLDGYIPYIDNWAICDTFCCSFKIVKKYRQELYPHISGLLQSTNPWAVRVGIILFMNYYLSDSYIDEILTMIKDIQSDEYYVQMAKAWFLATAFAKYREKTLPIIESGSLDDKTLRMTVQKCKDSYRISKQDKDHLGTLLPHKTRGDLRTTD